MTPLQKATAEWIEAIRADEREECAKIADGRAAEMEAAITAHEGSQEEHYGSAWMMEMAQSIAQQIRQRTTS